MTEDADIVKVEKELNKLISSGRLDEDSEFIRKAFQLLCNQTKKDGNFTGVNQALAVARIMLEEIYLMGEAVICLFLKSLYDHSIISKEIIESDFGTHVWKLITGLQKIDNLDTKLYRTNAENFIKLLLTLSDDINVILIRLGQRIYEMRHIELYPEEKQSLLAEETALLYVPIAHRIGLYTIKTELDDRVLKYTEPGKYSQIERKIRETQKDRDRYTVTFMQPIELILKENGFDCELKSRVKSISSINRKMQRQEVEFEKVYDLFAIRIILNNMVESEKSDCWKVYSLVTDIYTPNPKRLRDWTSFPKPTGYESLHTTVVGPSGKWVEVQIRTRRMDDIAEKGYAAHWKYQTGGKKEMQTTLYASIREMLAKPVKLGHEKPISGDKRELYSDEIFIFTPKGDLKKLKAGYSVLDFAFEIHTQIGFTCTGAIVNGKMVPLKHILQNGDTVRIMNSKNQKPNPGWLGILKSPRTIARVKHALKMEIYKDAEWGKEIIRNKLSQLGKELTDPVINKLISAFGCEHILDLYQKFGEGKIDPAKIKKVLVLPESVSTVPQQQEESFPARISEVLTGKEDFVIIDPAIRSIHYHFARCCSPVPGEKIFAFVSVSQGIKIHKTKCHNAYQLITRYPYRVLEARWKENLGNNESYSGHRS